VATSLFTKGTVFKAKQQKNAICIRVPDIPGENAEKNMNVEEKE
jgi:hypothetical protein